MVHDYDQLDERVAEIQALEKRGDEIDREINARLEDAFITPFDREDIHELDVRLDDVVDGIQAIAETFVIYGIDRADRRGAAARRDPRRSGGRARRRRCASSMGSRTWTPTSTRVHDLEHEADALSRAAVARLFREAPDAIEVIKWRDLYRELENTIDAAEDAAEAIERMFHKAT